MIMQTYITDQTNQLSAADMDTIIQISDHVAADLNLDENTEVSIVIIDNPAIHKINREARGKDQPTDVISFALEDDDSDEDIFAQLEDELPVLLGDIYISIDKVYEQAKDYGHSPETELAFLVVHGLLHLNGYDHQDEEEAAEMFGLQTKLLEELGYDA